MLPASPQVLLEDVRSLVLQTREGVARAVNSALALLYWQVGHRIRTEILKEERAAYGDEILATLSKELIAEFGSGFSVGSLSRMMRLAEVFPNVQIVAALSQQLGWSHFVAIIPLKDDLQRDFYAEMCRIERWSVRTLRAKIGSMLYERTALSRKPAELARQELDALRDDDILTPNLVFRDPYLATKTRRTHPCRRRLPVAAEMRLHVSDHLAGKQVLCPGCGALVSVPNSSDPEQSRLDGIVTKEQVPVDSAAPRGSVADFAFPPRQTLLRFSVLAFAILGGLIAGGTGAFLLSQTFQPRELESIERARTILRSGRGSDYDMTPEEAREVLAEHRYFLALASVLLAGGVLGIVGGGLGWARRPWTAVALLLIAALGPVVLLVPVAAIVSGPLVLAAVLAAFIRPKWKRMRTNRRVRPSATIVRNVSLVQSSAGQRAIGLLMLLACGGYTAWSWYTVLTEGYYYRLAVFFPAFAVIGFGLLAFPIDVQRYGGERPRSFGDLPPAWQWLFVLALVAALGNWLAMATW